MPESVSPAPSPTPAAGAPASPANPGAGSDPRAAALAAIAETIRHQVIHYGLWFAESVHAFGLEEALAMEQEAGQLGVAILTSRLERILGHFPGLEPETLKALLDAQATNWLALDGVWFQAVEKRRGMIDAKRINDACWARFSAFEAARIRDRWGLPANGGLAALKMALTERLYCRINVQAIEDDGPHAFIFRMCDCRVQSARNRKGLPDYPCKSGGITEYTGFARAIDPRIQVTCIACPPDAHPEGWYCAWRFALPPQAESDAPLS